MKMKILDNKKTFSSAFSWNFFLFDFKPIILDIQAYLYMLYALYLLLFHGNDE